MRTRHAIPIVVATSAVALALVLAGCAAPQTDGPGQSAAASAPVGSPGTPGDGDAAVSSDPVRPVGGDLADGVTWHLVWLAGPDATTGTEPDGISLVLRDGRIRGDGPVNSFTAAWTTTPAGGLAVTGITATERGGDPAALRQEAAVLDALAQVDGYTVVAAGELYLFDGQRQVMTWSTRPGGGAPTVDPATTTLATRVVGMTEADATALVEGAGLTVRVVSRDGQALAVTEDYRVDRVNLTIEDGTVTAASVG